jgi:hypothetical protein
MSTIEDAWLAALAGVALPKLVAATAPPTTADVDFLKKSRRDNILFLTVSSTHISHMIFSPKNSHRLHFQHKDETVSNMPFAPNLCDFLCLFWSYFFGRQHDI